MENINLIRKITWSFHRTSGLEWEDLFQEAALAYLEALKRYTPGKVARNTYLYHSITHALKNKLNKMSQRSPLTIPFSLLKKGEMEEEYEPEYLFERLTPQAQSIVDIVLEDHDTYCRMNPTEARKAILKQALSQGASMEEAFEGICDLWVSLKD